MIPLVDISKWQGRTNFEMMASRGVQGVIIRAGNGKTGDSAIATYMPAAKAAGLKVGVYWFCNPKVSDGATQGRLLAEAHNRWKCDIPPMLDVENYLLEPGSELLVVKGAAFAAWLRDMAETTESQSRKPIIYTNRAYWNPWVGDATFGHYDNIIARYPWYNPTAAAANTPPTDASKWGEWLLARTTSRPQVPTGWDGWTAWQFSAGYNKRGHFYGCSSTDLDLNIVKPDVWERWIGTRHVEPEKPIERPPVIEQPVEVGEDEDVSIATNAEQRDMGDGREGGWPVGWIKWAVVFNPSAGRFEKLHIDGNVYNGISGGRENSLANAALDAIPDYQVVSSPPELLGPLSVTFSGTGVARPE